MKYKSVHRLSLVAVALILLLAVIPSSCQRGAKVGNVSKIDTIPWKEMRWKLKTLVYNYYNNDQHDSLVIMSNVLMDSCRKHEDWDNYYETWIRLGEEYVYVGHSDSALMEAQKMHDEALSQGHDFGLAGADFVNAVVYESQENTRESSHLLRKVLDKLKGVNRPTFENKVYTYYLTELGDLPDYPEMKRALKEWRQRLDSLSQNLDTTTVLQDNLLNFFYMYQRGSYNYHFNMKEYREAAKAVDSIAYYNELTGMTDVARNEVLYDRIMLAVAQGHFEEALKLSDEQLSKIPAANKVSYQNALEQRKNILSGLGRWQEAYDCLLEWGNIKDSLRTKSTTDQLNELNKRFEVDEVKMQGEREKMQAERRQLYMVLTFILLAAAGTTLFIFQRYRSAKRMAKMKADQERIEGELNIARNIQMSMVPSTFPEHEGLDIYASMTPAKEVGGDLYGCIINGTKLYFAVGDVSGKGVPASLFMAQVTRLFSTMAHQGLEPAAICNRMNSELSGEDNVNGMFVTMFIGMLDMQTGHLAFCNAGHNPPVIGGDKHQGDFLKMISNVPIGLWPDYEFQGEEIDSVKGRALFIYTDGLNEAENLELEQFGNKRLLDILRDTQFDTARQVVEALEAEVAQHRNGAEPNDDLTMMCLRVQ